MILGVSGGADLGWQRTLSQSGLWFALENKSKSCKQNCNGPTELLGGMRPEALKGPAGNWALTTSSPSYPKQKHAVSDRGCGVREIVQFIGHLPFT